MLNRDLLRKRLVNLKALGLLGGKSFRCTEEMFIEDIALATDISQVEILRSRYLTIATLYYSEQEDGVTVEECATLDKCEAVIADCLEQQLGTDYEYTVEVYDLDAGKKLEYATELTIIWSTPP